MKVSENKYKYEYFKIYKEKKKSEGRGAISDLPGLSLFLN